MIQLKKETVLTKFLLNIIVALIISLVGFNLLRHTQFYRTTDQEVYGFFSMVRYALFEYPAETFANITHDYISFWEKRGENDSLRQYIETVSDWELKEKLYLEEIENLKALNGLDSVYSDIEMISGRVIDRSFESWNRIVTIDIGEKDGVSVNDGVISSHGMVGKVILVNENNSIVSLLTSNDDHTKISLIIEIDENTFVSGILNNYDYNSQTFDIQLMDSSDALRTNQRILTSGLGGHFPKGLYFGEVSEIRQVADGVGISVKANSDVNFNAIEYIRVVKTP